MRFPVLAGAALAFTVVMATSTAAVAHEEINPAHITTSKPTFFTLSAANEKQVGLIKVSVTAPKGVPIGEATRTPAGWTMNKSGADTVTWSASGQGVAPDAFESWGFETDGADQTGVATFKVDLGYADGKTESVAVPVTVVSGDAAGATSSHDGRAGLALVLAIVAVVVAAVAIALAARRRPSSSSPTPPATADGDW